MPRNRLTAVIVIKMIAVGEPMTLHLTYCKRLRIYVSWFDRWNHWQWRSWKFRMRLLLFLRFLIRNGNILYNEFYCGTRIIFYANKMKGISKKLKSSFMDLFRLTLYRYIFFLIYNSWIFFRSLSNKILEREWRRKICLGINPHCDHSSESTVCASIGRLITSEIMF